MDWVVSASEWAAATLEQAGTNPLALPLAFLLGLASAVASACCTLPVFGAIVGYAGIRESADRRSVLLGACSFMVGTIIALLILGSVAGLIGQVAQSALGQYWKVFAGIVAIVVGLGALNLLPFRLPGKKRGTADAPARGLMGAAVAGLVMGGAVSVCSLGCNPGIFIILGGGGSPGLHPVDVRAPSRLCGRVQPAAGRADAGRIVRQIVHPARKGGRGDSPCRGRRSDRSGILFLLHVLIFTEKMEGSYEFVPNVA